MLAFYIQPKSKLAMGLFSLRKRIWSCFSAERRERWSGGASSLCLFSPACCKGYIAQNENPQWKFGNGSSKDYFCHCKAWWKNRGNFESSVIDIFILSQIVCSINITPTTAKSSQQLPKVAKSCQKLPKVAKSCQKLPKFAKCSQKLPRAAKSCQKLQKVAKRCQKLPKVAKSCQKLPKVAKSCQKLSKAAKSC